MKRLIFLGGPMGVGKTTAARLLMDCLDRAVWLDGDWCWQQGRHWNFSEENRAMVLDNICHLLGSYLRGDSFDTILFTWVLHTRSIRDEILGRLPAGGFQLFDLSLTCSGEALRQRLASRGCDEETITRALERLSHFPVPRTYTLDTTAMTPCAMAGAVASAAGLSIVQAEQGKGPELVEIGPWITDFLQAVQGAFGSRLCFVGLQGSYGRGEAKPGSDIDTVVILDHVTAEDAARYREVLANLSHQELLCGFFSGREELLHWERGELFTFYHDTKPFFGTLDFLRPLVGEEAAAQAVHSGACAIYHACVHNLLYERDPALLAELRKSAFFLLRAKYYLRTKVYYAARRELLPVLLPEDRAIFSEDGDFFAQSARLMAWAAGHIRQDAAKTK